MIIAIPVEEKNINSQICISFGRTPYFMFYNTDTKEITYYDNSAINTQGGAGIKAAQKIIDEKSDILITARCGENSYEVLKDCVKIYKSQAGSSKDNIDAFLNNELSLLTDIHAGFHGHSR